MLEWQFIRRMLQNYDRLGILCSMPKEQVISGKELVVYLLTGIGLASLFLVLGAIFKDGESETMRRDNGKGRVITAEDRVLHQCQELADSHCRHL